MGLPLLLVPEDRRRHRRPTGKTRTSWRTPIGAHAVAPAGRRSRCWRARLLAARRARRAGRPRSAWRHARRRAGRAATVRRRARFTGTLHGVPWGRATRSTWWRWSSTDGRALRDAVAARAGRALSTKRQPAGEPRDTAAVRRRPSVRAAVPTPRSARRLRYHCALLRVGQIAGALRVGAGALDRVRLANGSSSASRSAASRPCSSSSRCSAPKSPPSAARRVRRFAPRRSATRRFEIAAAKLRANLAIDACTAIAHQVHGAIGFTHEYDLRHFTQRLWSWRSRVRQRPALERAARQRGDRARRRCVLGRPARARRCRRAGRQAAAEERRHA